MRALALTINDPDVVTLMNGDTISLQIGRRRNWLRNRRHRPSTASVSATPELPISAAMAGALARCWVSIR
jgi:hypothetical protein